MYLKGRIPRLFYGYIVVFAWIDQASSLTCPEIGEGCIALRVVAVGHRCTFWRGLYFINSFLIS